MRSTRPSDMMMMMMTMMMMMMTMMIHNVHFDDMNQEIENQRSNVLVACQPCIVTKITHR